VAATRVGLAWTPAVSTSDSFPADLPHSLTDPEIIRAHDWAAFQALDTMRNHWDRPGWDIGQHYYYWFLTFANPDLVNLANYGQQFLKDLPFDPVPLDGLHLTIARVGSADEISPKCASEILAAARRAIFDLVPIQLAIGPLTGSRGAVRFTVAPWGPLIEIHDRLLGATQEVLGGSYGHPKGQIRPHVGIAYCNGSTKVKPIVELLKSGRERPTVTVEVPAVELVVLCRAVREYRWARYDLLSLGGGGSTLPPSA